MSRQHKRAILKAVKGINRKARRAQRRANPVPIGGPSEKAKERQRGRCMGNDGQGCRIPHEMCICHGEET